MTIKRRLAEPPPGHPVPVRLQSIPDDETELRVRFLAQIQGLLVHWRKTQPTACAGRDCEPKIHRTTTTWKGYAPAERYRPEPWDDWAPCVIEVTERAFEDLLGSTLRGSIWTLWRQKGDTGLPEARAKETGACDPRTLRPAFALEPVLYRVYHTTTLDLGVEPRLPPRLILPACAGEAPADLPPSSAGEKPQRETLRAEIKRQILTGTLKDSFRSVCGRIVQEVEAELAQEKNEQRAVTDEVVKELSNGLGKPFSGKGRK